MDQRKLLFGLLFLFIIVDRAQPQCTQDFRFGNSTTDFFRVSSADGSTFVANLSLLPGGAITIQNSTGGTINLLETIEQQLQAVKDLEQQVALLRQTVNSLTQVVGDVVQAQSRVRPPLPWTVDSTTIGTIPQGPAGNRVDYTLPSSVPTNATNVLFHVLFMYGNSGFTGWSSAHWRVDSMVFNTTYSWNLMPGGIWGSSAAISGTMEKFWLPINQTSRKVSITTVRWDPTVNTFNELYFYFIVAGWQ